MLRDTHESLHLPMTYLKGSLEIMSTSRYAGQPDQHDAIVTFRDELRATS